MWTLSWLWTNPEIRDGALEDIFIFPKSTDTAGHRVRITQVGISLEFTEAIVASKTHFFVMQEIERQKIEKYEVSAFEQKAEMTRMTCCGKYFYDFC